MRKKFKSFFTPGRRFKREFKRQLRLLVTVTLGFTIAFTWRQTVFDVSQSIVNFFVHVQSSAVSSILTSTFITVISIALIYITSRYLKDSYENY